MRIVAWNCNGGLSRKASRLAALKPDVSVIAECTASEANRFAAERGASARWYGTNARKGFAVVAPPTAVFEPESSSSSPTAQAILATIHAPSLMTLLGVWTQKQTNRRYTDELHTVLDSYGPRLQGVPAIMVGDFNSNACFDKGERREHARFVERAAGLGLVSIYHAQSGEVHGHEKQPTYFHHRKREMAFHLDFAFVSESLLARLELEIGAPEIWLDASDHMPLMLDLKTT